MKKETQNYFSPGELAKLAGVSKQLLLYYDKNDIFSPDLTDDKGYRYYSLSQYFVLEILINMRKMDIPLNFIKSYLKNRNLNDLKLIYNQKLSECQHKIRQLQQYEASLMERVERLQKISNIDFQLNKILISEMPEQIYSQSNKILIEHSPKERIATIGKYMLPRLKSAMLDDCAIGFYLDTVEFLSCKTVSQYTIFVQKTNHADTDFNNTLKKNSGLYLSLYCNCYYGCVDNNIKNKIQHFIRINKLRICSGIFILPLRNHWSTKNTSDSISQICIQVEYEK